MSRPSFLQRLTHRDHDPEKGAATTPGGFSSTGQTLPFSEAGVYHSSNAPIEEHRVSASDRLAYFRRLIGIDHAPTLSVANILNRPAANVGIYTRVVRAEAQAKHQYKVFSMLINGCLGLQLVVAAALTAIGAANGSRSAVTVFGAINTVIAGFLTYLKGSGLPGRFKYFQTEWRKIREYIEQREREFGMEMCTLDVHGEARIIEIMYEAVRADVDANVPDSYQSVTRNRNAIGIGSTVGAKAAAVADVGGDPRRMTVNTLMDRVETAVGKEIETEQQRAARLGEKAQHGLEGQMSRTQQEFNDQMARTQQGFNDQVARTQLGLRTDFQSGLDQGQQQAQSGLTKGLESLHKGLEALNSKLDHGKERGQSELDRGRSEIEKGKSEIEHGKQALDSGVGRGLASFQEGLHRLDQGLERIGLQRHHHDEKKDDTKHDVKTDDKDADK